MNALLRILPLMILLSACLPKRQEDTQCPSGQTFDTTFKQCVADAILFNSAPIPYGNELTLQTEGAGPFNFAVNAASDGDGDAPLAYLVTTPPAYGTLTNCMNYAPDDPTPDLTCTYTPDDADFAGLDTFTYFVNDGKENSSFGATITINVASINDAPTYTTTDTDIVSGTGTMGDPYIINISEGDTTVLTLTLDEGGFTDEDTQDLDVTLSAIGGTNASAFTQSMVDFSYNIYTGTGASTFALTDASDSADALAFNMTLNHPSGPLGAADDISFDLTVNDQQSTTQVYFTVNVTSVNNIPEFTSTADQVAANSFNEGDAASSLNSGNLTSATDPESTATVVYEVVSAPTGTLQNCMDRDAAGGVVAATADVDCDYLPMTSEPTGGVDTFTYRACENTAGTNCSAAITVSINVTATNDDPSITTVAQTGTTMTEKKVITDPNVSASLTAGSDEEDAAGALTYKSITIPNPLTEGIFRDCLDLDATGAQTGTASNDLDCTFEPIVGFAGTVSVTYEVCDTSAVCSNDNAPNEVATLQVTVNAINDPPTASAIADYTFNEGLTTFSLNTTLDEGPGTSEDDQDLTITLTVDSTTNALMIPLANINLVTRDFGTVAASGGATGFDTGVGADASDTDLQIDISPVLGQTGSTTFKLEIDDGTNPVVEETFTITIDPYSALHGGWSAAAAQGDFQDANGNTLSGTEGYVYIAWEAMTIAGGTTATGWHVYRDEDADLDGIGDNGTLDITATPLTQGAPLANSARYFTDVDDDGGSNDLTEGKVYLYKVRPIASANGQVMDTSESYSTIRIMYPDANWSYVHKWIVNKTQCTAMGKTPVPLQDFGCTYTGPDAIDVSGTDYFKQANDLLVMTYEAGCNYTQAPNCTTSGCIGTNDPNDYDGGGSDYAGAAGDMYYNRDTAICYQNDGSGTDAWIPINTAATPVAATNSAAITPIYLPPMVFISATNAANYCTNLTAPADPDGRLGTPRLPDRTEQISFSLWDSSVSDTTINSYEGGAGMNSASRCNTNLADGITFVDQEVPTSAFADTLPATNTASSLSRALRTGSDLSAACISTFGIQDAVGNVAEWTTDTATCAADQTCGTTNFDDGLGTAPYTYAFDETNYGPCGHTAACADTNLTSWTIANQNNDATKFLVPTGLPVDNDTVGIDFLGIGTGAGEISSTKLHSDTIIINAPVVNAGAGDTGVFAGGGAFGVGGNDAGIWHFELTDDDSFSSQDDIGFRCVIPLSY